MAFIFCGLLFMWNGTVKSLYLLLLYLKNIRTTIQFDVYPYIGIEKHHQLFGGWCFLFTHRTCTGTTKMMAQRILRIPGKFLYPYLYFSMLLFL